MTSNVFLISVNNVGMSYQHPEFFCELENPDQVIDGFFSLQFFKNDLLFVFKKKKI
jgi:hypothetical protein